jgi:DNA protecting protein DprA
VSTLTQSQLLEIPGIGPKRSNAILKGLTEMGRTLDDLLRMPPAEIAGCFKVPHKVAEAIAKLPQLPTLDPAIRAALEAKGILTIHKHDVAYPKDLKRVLGEKAPAVIYAWGNLKLLNKRAVGFCGSRNATEKGIQVARDAAEQVADFKWVVVSGHARGVDTATHKAALENKAGTIIVAAEGLLNFKLRSELKQIAEPDTVLILSEFAPKAQWSVANAMTRNRTILALSDAMILVEARTEGGTFEAGKAALKLKIPLFVADYSEPGESAAGNEYFIKQGAVALRKSEETGKASLKHLREQVKHPHKPIATESQLTLFAEGEVQF